MSQNEIKILRLRNGCRNINFAAIFYFKDIVNYFTYFEIMNFPFICRTYSVYELRYQSENKAKAIYFS